MAEHFDPYHKWFGIKPHEQPPNAYRLLGVDLFEPDPDVIEAAAEQRLAFLQTVATGPHAEWSQRLMNEVEQARMCLLNPQRRAVYDQQLRAYLAALSQQAQATQHSGAPQHSFWLQQAAPPGTVSPVTPASAVPGHPAGDGVWNNPAFASVAPASSPQPEPPPASTPQQFTGTPPKVHPVRQAPRRAIRKRRRRSVPPWVSFSLAIGVTTVGLWGIYFALS
ncbi:MAG: hypothetical protein D6725_08635, partial [Planctomycetota bacterium]